MLMRGFDLDLDCRLRSPFVQSELRAQVCYDWCLLLKLDRRCCEEDSCWISDKKIWELVNLLEIHKF
jgi:hypothetical protein